MTAYNNSANDGFVKNVPVVKQLNAIFKSIPDETLIAALKASTGRPRYGVEVIWHIYVAMTVLGLPSLAQ